MSLVLGIVGTGNMGRGIAEVAIQCGFTAILAKATPGDLAAATTAIAASLERAVKKGKLDGAARDSALGRLRVVGQLAPLAEAEVVIESVIEDLGEKRKVFRALEACMPPSAVLASNTSSLPLSAVAEGLARPGRFLGIHFFSPVSAMKLVEVGALPGTDGDAIARAELLVEQLGKTAVTVADTPGYLVNRMLVPFLLDGMRLLEGKLATAAAIDTAMRLGLSHPLGPLALADAIGLDIVLAMADTLHRELSDPRFVAPPSLRRLVGRGHLGKKTGAGIYRYGAEVDENPARHA